MKQNSKDYGSLHTILGVFAIVILLSIVGGLIWYFNSLPIQKPEVKYITVNHYFETPEEFGESKIGDTLNCIIKSKDTSVIEFKPHHR